MLRIPCFLGKITYCVSRLSNSKHNTLNPLKSPAQSSVETEAQRCTIQLMLFFHTKKIPGKCVALTELRKRRETFTAGI